MWEKILASLLSTLLPASILAASPPVVEESSNITVSRPVVRLSDTNPVVQASAALAFEMDSSQILYAKDAEKSLPMASLTKLMVALIVMETMNLNAVVQVSNHAASIGGARMGLHSGDQLLIRDLLKGLLIPSGNDAAVALAEAVSGSESAFVDLMNERAEMLGLVNTRFANTTGYDQKDHYSSALDLGRLASLVYQYPVLQNLLKTQSTTVSLVNESRTLVLQSTNHLFQTEYGSLILGGKTGTTVNAGQCLIEILENPFGRRVVNVLLGSPDRYNDMISLITWEDKYLQW